MFSALITKEVKKRFDDTYGKWLANRGNVGDMEVDKVKQRLRSQMHELFRGMKAQVK